MQHYILLTGTLPDGFTFTGPYPDPESAERAGKASQQEWLVVPMDPPEVSSWTWHVNVYEHHRAYGGPEEGGWFYDVGRYQPQMSVVLDRTEYTAEQANDFARELAERLNAEADEAEVPPVGSVHYLGGRYTVQTDDKPGADWPAERPHYS